MAPHCLHCREPGAHLECTRCRAAWYCNESCAHAQWAAGGLHRQYCAAAAAANAPAAPRKRRAVAIAALLRDALAPPAGPPAADARVVRVGVDVEPPATDPDDPPPPAPAEPVDPVEIEYPDGDSEEEPGRVPKRQRDEPDAEPGAGEPAESRARKRRRVLDALQRELGVPAELLPGLVNDVALHEVLPRLPPEAVDALARVSRAWRDAVFAHLTVLPLNWRLTRALAARLPRLREITILPTGNIQLSHAAWTELGQRLRVVRVGHADFDERPNVMRMVLLLPLPLPALRELYVSERTTLWDKVLARFEMPALEVLDTRNRMSSTYGGLVGARLAQLLARLPRTLRVLRLNPQHDWTLLALPPDLPALEELELNNVNMHQLPAALPRLRQLTTDMPVSLVLPAVLLQLRVLRLKNTFATLPAALPALEELVLDRVTPPTLPDKLPQLRTLRITSDSPYDPGVTFVLPAALPALEELELATVNVAALPRALPLLRTLRMRDVGIEAEHKMPAALPQLQELALRAPYAVTLPAVLPQLQTLTLGVPYAVTLPAALPLLRSIAVNTLRVLRAPLPALPALETLRVADEFAQDLEAILAASPELVGADPYILRAVELPALRVLQLGGDPYVAALPAALPALAELDLGTIRTLGGVPRSRLPLLLSSSRSAIEALPASLPQLRRLNLNGNNALRALPPDMPLLEELRLGRNTTLAALPDALPALWLLDLGSNTAVANTFDAPNLRSVKLRRNQNYERRVRLVRRQ